MDSRSSSGRSEFSSSPSAPYFPPSSKSSSAPSGPSSTSPLSSSAPLTPSTRRSLRLAQAATSSSSSLKAPSQVPELYSQDYLDQEAKARRIFRKLAREYHERKEMPNQEALDQLNNYNEILRDKIVSWRAEVSDSLRVEFFEGRVRFLEYPTAPHDQVSRLFGDLFNETMGVPFPLHLRPFIADGTTGIAPPLTVLLTMADVVLLNGDQLQPDEAFRLWNPRIPGIATQPNGQDYPCVVFEMANSERMVDVLRRCELWLS